MTWSEWKIKENCHVLVNQFHGNFNSKTLGCRKIKSVFRNVKLCFNASWGFKGLKQRCVNVSCLLWQDGCVISSRGNINGKLNIISPSQSLSDWLQTHKSLYSWKRKRWLSVVSMLDRRRRRWPNIETALSRCLVFAEFNFWYHQTLAQCWYNVASLKNVVPTLWQHWVSGPCQL